MTYLYYCKKCGHEQDEWHNMKNSPEIKCEKCKSLMRKKITGGSGIIYRGNGWPRKGSGLIGSPKKSIADIGVKVDHDKKKAMEEAGET